MYVFGLWKIKKINSCEIFVSVRFSQNVENDDFNTLPRLSRSLPLFFRPSGKSRSPLVPPAFALFPSPTAQINGRERDLLKAVRECRSQQPGHSARPTP